MNAPSWLLASALAALAVLLWLWLRARRDAGVLNDRLENASQQLQNLQLSFSRFAPDEVIERVIAEGAEGRGEKKEATVLFADLVGFTALCERVEPDVLVRILNGYFERMSEAIAEHRGHVSTFIGDGILALFGAHAPNPWQGNDAAHAALAMQAALRDYNIRLADEELPVLRLGIGLHRGTGVAGLVGSQQLMEFAFVGRTVNVAARVQDLTRVYDADVIVTEALRATLDARFTTTPLPDTEVKGVEGALEIWSVTDYEASGPVLNGQNQPANQRGPEGAPSSGPARAGGGVK